MLDGITYQEESFKDFIVEFDALLKPHMAEINVSERLGFKFKPDYNKYVKLQELGILVVVTCRHHKRLIGYTVFGISPNIRYGDCNLAKEDLYYIVPEYRGKGIGKKLFIETEKVLKDKGANQIIFTTKTYSDNSHIFEKLGYEFFEKLFTKRI
jgi:GNAT superfamily N-acetyltransferase